MIWAPLSIAIYVCYVILQVKSGWINPEINKYFNVLFTYYITIKYHPLLLIHLQLLNNCVINEWLWVICFWLAQNRALSTSRHPNRPPGRSVGETNQGLLKLKRGGNCWMQKCRIKLKLWFLIIIILHCHLTQSL